MSETSSKSARYVSQQSLANILEGAALDAVVVQSAKNVGYLSGHPRVGSSQKPGGPGAALAVANRTGETTLVVGRWHSGMASRVSWADEIAKFRNFSQSGFHTVADVLENEGLAAGTIGIEMNYVSEADYLTLRGALPEAEFVDIGDLIDGARVIKGAEELDRSTDAYNRLEQALLRGLQQSRIGDSRIKVHNRIMREILAEQTDTGRGGIAAAGETIVPLVSTSDMPIVKGDVLTAEYSCSFGPFAAYVSRTVFVEGFSSDSAERYSLHQTALKAGLEILEPGITAGDAAQAVLSAFEARGIPCVHRIVGHGLALGFEDLPMLSPGTTTKLMPGMEFIVNPRTSEGLLSSIRVIMGSAGVSMLDNNLPSVAPLSLHA